MSWVATLHRLDSIIAQAEGVGFSIDQIGESIRLAGMRPIRHRGRWWTISLKRSVSLGALTREHRRTVLVRGECRVSAAEKEPETPLQISVAASQRRGLRGRLAFVNANRRPGLNPVADSKFRLAEGCDPRRAGHQPGWEADATSMILQPKPVGINPTRAIPRASATSDRRTAS